MTPATTSMLETSDYDVWLASSLGELLAHAPDLQANSLGALLRRNLSMIIDTVGGGNRAAFAHAAHCSRAVIGDWLAGKTLPRFDILLPICYWLKVQPVDLFTDAGPKFNVNDCRELLTAEGQDVRLLRRRKEIEVALKEALTEGPPPTLHGLARRMGYRSTSWFYNIDLALCKQITANNRKWKREQLNRKQVRICTGLDDIKAALESALAQEQAISVSEVATNMGYANCTCVRKKFPELCGAISRRFAEQRRARVESVLLDALGEDPPPTVHKIVRRARSNTIALRKTFPHLWDRLCARRKSFQEEWAAELRQSLEEALRENPAPSIRTVCLRLDLHPVMLAKMFPDLRAAIRTRYEQAKIETAKTRRERLREEVRQIIVELYRKGVYPSLDRIWSSLSENSLSNWAVIIRTWKQAKLELGISMQRLPLRCLIACHSTGEQPSL